MPTRSSEAIYRPDIALAFDEFDEEANRVGFVGLKIAPVREVGVAGTKFAKTPLESMLQDVDDTRAANGEYGQVSGKVEWDQFTTEEHGLEERVDRRQASINRLYYDSELLAARRTRNGVLTNHEKRVVALALTVSNTAAVSNGAWTVHATATPIDDVFARRKSVRAACGYMPDAMCLDEETFEDCRMCAQVLDRAPGGTGASNPKRVSQEVLAEILGLREIIVSGASKNTGNRGQDSFTLKPIWPRDKVLLFCKRTGADMTVPQFMRTFHYGEDGSTIGSTFETYYCEKRRSDIVRHRMDTEEKILYQATATLLTGVAGAP